MMHGIQDTKKLDLHRFRLGVLGFFKCLALLFRNRNTHYVISTFGIGDAIMACTYLRAYRETYGIRHITLVGKKNKEEIFKLFVNEYDELLLLDDLEVVKLSDAFLLNMPYTLIYKWMFKMTPAVIMCHIKNFELTKSGCLFNETTMNGLYRALVYMLKDNTADVMPNMDFLPDITEKCESLGAIRGKSILLIPDANSVTTLSEDFWSSLVVCFTKRGFTCFTNVVKSTDYPLPSTKAVALSLAETAAFANYCGNVIALRSGMCDLIQFVDCKMAIVYSGIDGEKTKNFYSLSESSGKANIKEFIIDSSDISSAKVSIEKFIEESAI